MDSKKIIDRHIDNILTDIVHQGASSAGIMIFQSEKLIFYKSTCDKWHDFYNNSKERLHCHLVKNSITRSNEVMNTAGLSKVFSLVWDLQIPHNCESIYLNEQRERFNHCHGISIIDVSEKNTLIGMPLTGRRCDINFAHDIFANKSKIAHGLKVLKILTRSYWNNSLN